MMRGIAFVLPLLVILVTTIIIDFGLAGGADEPAKPHAATVALESEIRERVNDMRKEKGVPPLRESAKATAIAREHSRAMARGHFFAHESPTGESLQDRARRAGLRYRLLGENLAQTTRGPGRGVATRIVEGWMQSPGHRENILREGFTHTGVAAWREGERYYITQIFYAPLSPR